MKYIGFSLKGGFQPIMEASHGSFLPA